MAKPLEEPIMSPRTLRSRRATAAIVVGIVVAFVAGAAATRLITQSQVPLRQGTLSIRVHMSTTGQYQISVNEAVVSSGANPFAGGTVLLTRTVSWQTSEACQTLSVEARLVPFEGPPTTSNSFVRLCDGGSDVTDLYL